MFQSGFNKTLYRHQALESTAKSGKDSSLYDLEPISQPFWASVFILSQMGILFPPERAVTRLGQVTGQVCTGAQ